MSLHELTLGGLSLDGIDSVLTDEGWMLRVKSAASGTSFGTSEAVVSAVDAMGADGGQARIDGYANAVTTLQLQILGVDATALAKGEAAVRRVLPDGWGAPVDLLWRAPDGQAPASVRVVLTGVLGSPSTGSEWDRDEVRLARTFPLVLTHRPGVRSEHLTITAALPPSATAETTVVDDCTSATGWTARLTDWSTAPVLTAGANGLVVEHPPSTGPKMVQFTRAGVVNFAALPYLVVEARVAGDSRVARWEASGTLRAPMVSQALSDGFTRYVFRTSGVASQFFVMRLTGTVAAGGGGAYIRKVSLTSQHSATPRQSARIINVGGTERTPGTLTVSSRNGTTATGLTLIHTCPDDGTGYDPDLNRWVTSGPAQVDDVNAPMGGWRTLTDYLNAVVPWHTFPAATSYQIGALVRSDTAQEVTIEWSAWSWIDSVPTRQVLGERIVTLEAGKLAWVPMGRTTLPTIQARRGGVMLSLNQTAGTAVKVGGWYAFRSGRDSALTVVDSPKPRLFIEVGEGSEPGSWMIGDAADGSDAYTLPSGIKSPGVHVFRAGRVASYVVTQNTNDPAVEFAHHHWWTANAADDGLTS